MSTVETRSPRDTGTAAQEALGAKWMRLWNAEYDIAGEIVAPTVRLHLPKWGMPPEEGINTPARLAGWIEMFRSSYSTAKIETELGPFVAGDFLIGRWVYRGVWQSGRPATATAPAGTPVEFRGADVLRLENGRIAEYWLSDDLLDVYGQLDAHPNP